MTIKQEHVVLPEEAQAILKKASKTGKPDSLERRRAIDSAIEEVRRRFPSFFIKE